MDRENEGVLGWVQHIIAPLLKFLAHPPIHAALKIAGKLILGYGIAIAILYVMALNSQSSKTLQTFTLLGFFLLPLSLFILARRFDKQWKQHVANRRKKPR